MNEEIKRLEKVIEKSETGLREQKDRLRIMEQHLFNVQQEVRPLPTLDLIPCVHMRIGDVLRR